MASARIPIIEDEAEIRENLKMFLELEGFQIFSAENGKEALEILDTIPQPCLILLDLLMPVMTGNEFLKAKSLQDQLAAIPVYVISGVANIPKLNGISGFIKKPFELDRVLSMVKRFCTSVANEEKEAA